MNAFIIPAVLGLVINSIVLVAAYQSRERNPLFTIMVAVFVLLMACEALGFLELFNGGQFEYLIRTYYVILIFGLVLALAYATKISQSGFPQVFIWAFAAVLSALIMFTDYVVAGSESIGYMRTALQGSGYWVFQVFAVALQISLPAVLIKGYRNPRDHDMQIQCAYTLIGILPIFLWSVIVLLLMAFGFAINAVIFMPIVVTFFVVLTLMSESKHKLIDVRRFIPFSDERQTSNKMMEIYTKFNRDEMDYREAVSQIEKLFVLSKYEKSGGNASATAKLLGLPRSSLYSIFSRLDIEYKD